MSSVPILCINFNVSIDTMLNFDASIDVDTKCEGTLRFGGCDIHFVKCCPNNRWCREIFLVALHFICLHYRVLYQVTWLMRRAVVPCWTLLNLQKNPSWSLKKGDSLFTSSVSHISAMIIGILFSSKAMESLKNGLQPKSGVTPIVCKENRIVSIIAELMQHWHWYSV